jgi:predicted house-cleaning noncanonical NTP pyrophosphatase (MazG superfamily)
MENLQALCFACNRAKRDADESDFRRTRKLVRDLIPEIIRKEGRKPIVRRLSGARLLAALHDKLVEEHEEFIAARDADNKVEELADMIEVALAIAHEHGIGQAELMDIAQRKRERSGGFTEGWFYEGDD